MIALEWLRSAGGRVALMTAGFALSAAGGLAVVGPGPHLPWLCGWVALACVAGTFAAIGLSIERHGLPAGLLILALILFGGPYFMALPSIAASSAKVATALIVAGLPALAAAAWLRGAPRTAALADAAAPREARAPRTQVARKRRERPAYLRVV